MNKEPTPELPHDECMHCNKQYTLTKANAYIFRYEDMPWAEHLSCLCPHCSAINTLFLDESAREHYAGYGYGVHKQAVPSFEVMQAYLDLYEIPRLEAKELTEKEENAVKWMGYLLANDQLSVDDFVG